ncbi:ribonuclease H-like domain-containing protein [Tanacetum coccineum]
MNQFCEMKGILRQFSIARTPQQNGVVERRNRTLIETARTITATLRFIRPFGCPVTILNTIDHLGKFNGKADEGFFVGYSLNSKAFRVFNSRTRIVEENLHIRFSENTPNVVGNGPDWLFDIDALTRTMNYEPIVIGTQSNDFACTKASDTVANEAVYKELDDSLVRVVTTACSLEAEQDSGNIIKTRSKATPNEAGSHRTTSGGGPRSQETMGDIIAQTRFKNVSKLSNDPLVVRGNTLQSGEDSLKLNELMESCTNLQTRVLDLEKTKTTQAEEIVNLKRRVKKLE